MLDWRRGFDMINTVIIILLGGTGWRVADHMSSEGESWLAAPHSPQPKNMCQGLIITAIIVMKRWQKPSLLVFVIPTAWNVVNIIGINTLHIISYPDSSATCSMQPFFWSRSGQHCRQISAVFQESMMMHRRPSWWADVGSLSRQNTTTYRIL